MMPIVYILVLIALLLVYFIIAFNKLVKSRNIKREAWSGIDVQLKQRHELVPNLVNLVKGYARHEKKLLEEITITRSSAMGAKMISDRGGKEGFLGTQLSKLLVVVENYPDLKADKNFLDFQKKLSDIENTLQHARRYYNGAVRDLNNLVEAFPSSIVASISGFKEAEFFQLDDPSENIVPDIDLH